MDYNLGQVKRLQIGAKRLQNRVEITNRGKRITKQGRDYKSGQKDYKLGQDNGCLICLIFSHMINEIYHTCVQKKSYSQYQGIRKLEKSYNNTSSKLQLLMLICKMEAIA